MIARAMIRMIRWYQKKISPHTMPHCRFVPTCSQYAIDAITRYGPFKGGLMGIWRIIRCNPFCKGGYDPVK